MNLHFRHLQHQPAKVLLAVALGVLSWQLYLSGKSQKRFSAEMVLNAEDGGADMSLRNADYPRTFVKEVLVDLSSPKHWVKLTWEGPLAEQQMCGPFHSSPGKGKGMNDCNDTAESQRGGSNCTPKGTRVVEGFGDFMPSAPNCKFITWFHSSREIAVHSHRIVPDYPESIGCVRVSENAAQLIHNNSIAGRTQVIVAGEWTPPPGSGWQREQ